MYRKILIFKPGAIGDLLHITPVIRYLKTIYNQDAQIDLIVGEYNTSLLFKYNPYVNNVYIFNNKQNLEKIKKNKYDLIINFQRSNIKGWFFLLRFLPSKILIYHKNENLNAILNHFNTLYPLKKNNFYNFELNLDLFLSEKEIKFAEKFIEDNQLKNKKIIAINPNASNNIKRWEADYFIKLINLIKMHNDYEVILIGSKDEIKYTENIYKNVDKKIINICGKTNLLETAAILKKSNYLITGDTGPMHIAAAIGTKVIALFGPTDPNRTGPVGKEHIVLQANELKCVPCKKRKCENTDYLQCMKKITPEQVLLCLSIKTGS